MSLAIALENAELYARAPAMRDALLLAVEFCESTIAEGCYCESSGRCQACEAVVVRAKFLDALPPSAIERGA